MVLSDNAADLIRIEKATIRLERAFQLVGPNGVVMASFFDHELEFIGADRDPVVVVADLAAQYMTTAAAIASELLNNPLYDAGECHALDC